MSTKKTSKLFAFIDAENIRNAALEAGYEDFDYQKLCDWLLNKKNVKRVFIYVPIEDSDTVNKATFESLHSQPDIEVRIKRTTIYPRTPYFKKVTCPSCSHVFTLQLSNKPKQKGNCDAEMTLDIVRYGVRKKYAGIVAFSGDGDFEGVYRYVSTELKKSVYVYCPLGAISKRTSKKIKDLAGQGIIHMEGLNTLFANNCKRIV